MKNYLNTIYSLTFLNIITKRLNNNKFKLSTFFYFFTLFFVLKGKKSVSTTGGGVINTAMGRQ